MNSPNWQRDSFCDWRDIQPHPTQPCKGGCGIRVDASDGYCRACREAAKQKESPDAA